MSFNKKRTQFSNIMRKGRSVNVGLCFVKVAYVLLFERNNNNNNNVWYVSCYATVVNYSSM
jgi:hypothetical protein